MVISPQLQRSSRETGEQKDFAFELLRDAGNRVSAKFGLVFTLPADLREVYGKFGIDLPRANGDDSWTLPMPARYVIDRTGTIRSAEADPDYRRRPEPAQTVEALRTLTG
mgnify:CR=1 FL=1